MASLLVFPQSRQKIHESFVAFGYLNPGTNQVWGQLVENKSNRVIVPIQTRILDNKRWIMFFNDIERDDVKNLFTLSIFCPDSPDKPVAEAYNLVVDDAGGGIEILYPQQGDTVATDFAAYGTTDQPVSVGIDCKKIENEAHSKDASSSVLRDGANWAVFFEGVPADDDYTITISHNSNCQGGDSVDDITVTSFIPTQ